MATLNISLGDAGLQPVAQDFTLSTCDVHGDDVHPTLNGSQVVRKLTGRTGDDGTASVELTPSSSWDQLNTFWRFNTTGARRVFAKSSGVENLTDTTQPVPAPPTDGSFDTTDLADWSTAPPIDGDVPVYDDETGEWTPVPVPGLSPMSTTSLTDWSPTAPVEGDVATFDLATGDWTPKAPTVPELPEPEPLATTDLTDWSAAAPAEGDVATFDLATGEWTPQALPDPPEIPEIPTRAVLDLGPVSGPVVLDLALASDWTLTATGPVELSAVNVPAGEGVAISILATQDAVGGHGGTFPPNTSVVGTPSIGPGERTIVALITYDGGASWFAVLTGFA